MADNLPLFLTSGGGASQPMSDGGNPSANSQSLVRKLHEPSNVMHPSDLANNGSNIPSYRGNSAQTSNGQQLQQQQQQQQQQEQQRWDSDLSFHRRLDPIDMTVGRGSQLYPLANCIGDQIASGSSPGLVPSTNQAQQHHYHRGSPTVSSGGHGMPGTGGGGAKSKNHYGDLMPLSAGLLEAVKSQNNPEIQRLLKKGVDVNATEAGGTALHLAAKRGDVATIELLLFYGADRTKRDSLGYPPEFYANKNGLSIEKLYQSLQMVLGENTKMHNLALLTGAATENMRHAQGTSPFTEMGRLLYQTYQPPILAQDLIQKQFSHMLAPQARNPMFDSNHSSGSYNIHSNSSVSRMRPDVMLGYNPLPSHSPGFSQASYDRFPIPFENMMRPSSHKPSLNPTGVKHQVGDTFDISKQRKSPYNSASSQFQQQAKSLSGGDSSVFKTYIRNESHQGRIDLQKSSREKSSDRRYQASDSKSSFHIDSLAKSHAISSMVNKPIETTNEVTHQRSYAATSYTDSLLSSGIDAAQIRSPFSTDFYRHSEIPGLNTPVSASNVKMAPGYPYHHSYPNGDGQFQNIPLPYIAPYPYSTHDPKSKRPQEQTVLSSRGHESRQFNHQPPSLKSSFAPLEPVHKKSMLGASNSPPVSATGFYNPSKNGVETIELKSSKKLNRSSNELHPTTMTHEFDGRLDRPVQRSLSKIHEPTKVPQEHIVLTRGLVDNGSNLHPVSREIQNPQNFENYPVSYSLQKPPLHTVDKIVSPVHKPEKDAPCTSTAQPQASYHPVKPLPPVIVIPDVNENSTLENDSKHVVDTQKDVHKSSGDTISKADTDTLTNTEGIEQDNKNLDPPTNQVPSQTPMESTSKEKIAQKRKLAHDPSEDIAQKKNRSESTDVDSLSTDTNRKQSSDDAAKREKRQRKSETEDEFYYAWGDAYDDFSSTEPENDDSSDEDFCCPITKQPIIKSKSLGKRRPKRSSSFRASDSLNGSSDHSIGDNFSESEQSSTKNRKRSKAETLEHMKNKKRQQLAKSILQHKQNKKKLKKNRKLSSDSVSSNSIKNNRLSRAVLEKVDISQKDRLRKKSKLEKRKQRGKARNERDKNTGKFNTSEEKTSPEGRKKSKYSKREFQKIKLEKRSKKKTLQKLRANQPPLKISTSIEKKDESPCPKISKTLMELYTGSKPEPANVDLHSPVTNTSESSNLFGDELTEKEAQVLSKILQNDKQPLVGSSAVSSNTVSRQTNNEDKPTEVNLVEKPKSEEKPKKKRGRKPKNIVREENLNLVSTKDTKQVEALSEMNDKDELSKQVKKFKLSKKSNKYTKQPHTPLRNKLANAMKDLNDDKSNIDDHKIKTEITPIAHQHNQVALPSLLSRLTDAGSIKAEEEQLPIKPQTFDSRSNSPFSSQPSSSALNDFRSFQHPNRSRASTPLSIFKERTPHPSPLPPNFKKLSCNSAIGETVLHKAARHGYLDNLQHYLDRGFDVNTKDNAGYTALHEACVQGRLDTARLLLEFGANLNLNSTDGTRPVHDAIEYDHLEMTRLLLSCGADPLLSKFSGRAVRHMIRSPAMDKFMTAYIKELKKLSQETIADSGLEWKLAASSIFDSEKSQGYSVTANVPEDITYDDFVEIEVFDEAPLQSYFVQPSSSSSRSNYYLLVDLLQKHKCSRGEFLLKFPVDIKTMQLETLMEEAATNTIQKKCQHIDETITDSNIVELVAVDKIHESETMYHIFEDGEVKEQIRIPKKPVDLPTEPPTSLWGPVATDNNVSDSEKPVSILNKQPCCSYRTKPALVNKSPQRQSTIEHRTPSCKPLQHPAAFQHPPGIFHPRPVMPAAANTMAIQSGHINYGGNNPPPPPFQGYGGWNNYAMSSHHKPLQAGAAVPSINKFDYRDRLYNCKPSQSVNLENGFGDLEAQALPMERFSTF